MKKFVDVTWQNNMFFEVSSDNHKFSIDAGDDSGGSDLGPRPKPLMLAALGGCTGMDVVFILKKMKVPFSRFNVRVEGDLTEEHPKHFHQMKIIYELSGKDIDKSKVEKAVDLSLKSYCGVYEVYRKTIDIAFEIVINNE